MRRPRWRLGLVLAALYLALAACAAGYLLYRVTFAPRNSEFVGLPLVILELPWSPLVVLAADHFWLIQQLDEFGRRMFVRGVHFHLARGALSARDRPECHAAVCSRGGTGPGRRVGPRWPRRAIANAVLIAPSSHRISPHE